MDKIINFQSQKFYKLSILILGVHQYSYYARDSYFCLSSLPACLCEIYTHAHCKVVYSCVCAMQCNGDININAYLLYFAPSVFMGFLIRQFSCQAF